ncbi:MAG: hypothetical protein COZ85_00450 [Candidatus Moranbacteria bacterium CG_4_8_14_3_um_filter_34_16]|nr:MAG: hypothetical protein COT31_03620 [Candidatus Moranbacteria bacterium CG08_land_8_20_14_0_20_34_16]PIW95329.1 MAG: hypothetical protein COZ85_00450 [Candidatus Moranbacteria bacterium CG_4_8_14_3_um_filter_34_16]
MFLPAGDAKRIRTEKHKRREVEAILFGHGEKGQRSSDFVLCTKQKRGVREKDFLAEKNLSKCEKTCFLFPSLSSKQKTQATNVCENFVSALHGRTPAKIGGGRGWLKYE